MERDYLDFDVSIEETSTGQVSHVTWSPVGTGLAPFSLPFKPVELAQFMNVVGPPRVTSRRLVPAERVVDVKDFGKRLGDALLAGEVGTLFKKSLSTAKQQGRGLRLRLNLAGAPDLEPVPWEYVYDSELGRFLTLSSQTPIVRALDALDVPPAVAVTAPLRVLVMISSPSDVPELAVKREEELLKATTADLVKSGRLELVVLSDATLGNLQKALLDTFHVFHFIGHGGFDKEADEGVLVLERQDGTAHRVEGSRLGTLLHDATGMQLVVLNACEGARTSGRDAFSGVAQALVRQGLPAVVAMQTEISDRAALVFSHEFYYFLTRGLPIDAAMCEVRKAMATSDEASEWGTAVLVRSGSSQPFDVSAVEAMEEPAQEGRWEALYDAAQDALRRQSPAAALPILEQLASEQPDYADVTELIERVSADVEHEGSGSGGAHTGGSGGAGTGGSGGASTGGSGGAGTGGPGTAPPVTPPAPDPDWPPPPPRPGPGPGPEPKPSGRIGRYVGAGVAVLLAVLGFLYWLGSQPEPGAPGTAGRTSGSVSPSDPADAVTAACGPSAEVAEGELVVACTTTPPVIDGAFTEWENVSSVSVETPIFPKDGSNPNGVHGQARAVWDRDALYVQASVVDPVVRDVNEDEPDQYWKGDAVSFEFGPDSRNLGGDAGVRNGRDRHVIIGISAGRALASMNTAAGGDFPSGGAVDEIEAAVTLTDDGYHVEARVPWHVLDVDEPTRGAVFAGNVNISDAKPDFEKWALQTMVSSNPERFLQRRPAIWQTIVLGDPA